MRIGGANRRSRGETGTGSHPSRRRMGILGCFVVVWTKRVPSDLAQGLFPTAEPKTAKGWGLTNRLVGERPGGNDLRRKEIKEASNL